MRQPIALVILSLAATTGCRDPEYRFLSLDPVSARGAEVIERDAVELGMGDGLVCEFSADLAQLQREVVIQTDRPLDALDHRLLCSTGGLRIFDDGEATFVVEGAAARKVTQTPERLVDAVCLEQGWIGLTEDCVLRSDDGLARPVEDCAGHLRRSGPQTAAYFGGGVAIDVRSGADLGDLDDVHPSDVGLLELRGGQLQTPAWSVPLRAPAYEVYPVGGRVHVRHRDGTLSVFEGDDGALLSVLDDPMPHGGRVLGRDDSGYAYHLGARRVSPYVFSYGSLPTRRR